MYFYTLPLSICKILVITVLQLLNQSIHDDPEMPLAMAAYRALNEVVKRSKGSYLQSFNLLPRIATNLILCVRCQWLLNFIHSEETTHGLIVELGAATDYLAKASKNISLKSVAQIYMFFITGASRNFTVCS